MYSVIIQHFTLSKPTGFYDDQVHSPEWQTDN